METNNSEKKVSQNDKLNTGPVRKIPTYLIAIFITLAILTPALIVYTVIISNQRSDFKEAKYYLELEQKRLENELNQISVVYDSLKTNNDSINLLLESEQKKIEKLLKVRAENWKKIELYKKELGTLREIMRSYIVQIDSLNMKNKELTDENIKVRSELLIVENINLELSKQTEELSQTVEKASQLQAKDIIITPQNSRGNEKYKIDKIDKIKVCFTIRENAVSEPGDKVVYFRIIRPDDIVLASSANNNFELKGELIVYSAKRSLKYENQDIDFCIFWDKNEELIEGTYKAELYCEEALMGETTFALK